MGTFAVTQDNTHYGASVHLVHRRTVLLGISAVPSGTLPARGEAWAVFGHILPLYSPVRGHWWWNRDCDRAMWVRPIDWPHLVALAKGVGSAFLGNWVVEDGEWSPHKLRGCHPWGGKHSEAGDGRPVDRGVWTANTVKRPRQQPAHPQYANYWAPLTRKRHTMPHSAQSQHANYWAPRTRKQHQQEHRPQRPTESSDPTQHAKGRTGDRPGPHKGATTRRNVTQGGVFRPPASPS